MERDMGFNLIVIGNSGCGKSCLLLRFVTNQFVEDCDITLGLEYRFKLIKIDHNIKVCLRIWDTAGQESFRAIVRSYYRDADAVVIVYDITNRKSFEDLVWWLNQARQNTKEAVMFILVGTHLDLASQREVETVEAEKWMIENNIEMHFQTSAKTSENVSKAFEEIGKQLFVRRLTKKSLSREQMQEATFSLSSRNVDNEQCC